ncbi:MAG: hypothetical protein R6U89_07155 [Dehalococcoidia bacterium]
MEMLLAIILQLGGSIVGFFGKVIMSVFVNWWRNRCLAQIAGTITHENIRIMAEEKGQVPQLNLSWQIQNRSLFNVAISRIRGDLYIGAWRIASFETQKPQEKLPGYSWDPPVTVRQRFLKKRDRSSIEVVLFPPIEFWISGAQECSLYNTSVDVSCLWGTVTTTLDTDIIKIDQFEQAAAKYQSSLKTKLKPILE